MAASLPAIPVARKFRFLSNAGVDSPEILATREFPWSCTPSVCYEKGKENDQNHVGITDLAGAVKMIRQRCPPRHLDQKVKQVFPFSSLGRLNFQTRQLSIKAIKNSNNQGQQCSNLKVSQSIKYRHA